MGDLLQTISINVTLAGHFWTLGDTTRGEEHYQAAVHISERAGMLPRLAIIVENVALATLIKGNLQLSSTLLDRSFQVSPVPQRLVQCAISFFFAGQYKRALDAVRRAIVLCDEKGSEDAPTVIWTLWLLSLLALFWRHPEIISSLGKISQFSASGSDVTDFGARVSKLCVAIFKGDHDAIRTIAKEMRGNYIPSAMSEVASLTLGLGAYTLGELDDAIRLYETAHAGYEEVTPRNPHFGWACLFLAEVLLKRSGPGDEKKADDLIHQGRTIAENVGMPPLIERFEKLER